MTFYGLDVSHHWLIITWSFHDCLCSVEALQWLTEQGGADLFLTAADGMTALHAAAQAGQTACLEYLVTKGGVSVCLKAEDGATPAHFAAASGQVCSVCVCVCICVGVSVYVCAQLVLYAVCYDS